MQSGEAIVWLMGRGARSPHEYSTRKTWASAADFDLIFYRVDLQTGQRQDVVAAATALNSSCYTPFTARFR